jgi:hypothetical protein
MWLGDGYRKALSEWCLFLFTFCAKQARGFIHHFISADNGVSGQVKEIAKK